jgi:homoserine O-acetyltransferase
VIEEPITSDPHWNSGFYADRLDVQAGLRRQGHRMALTLPPLSYYHGNVLRSLGFASVDDFVRGFFEGFMIGQDPNNLLIFVYAFTGEVMFPPEDCRLDAARTPGARFHELTMTSGHLTTFGLFPADKQAVDDAIREVLAN